MLRFTEEVKSIITGISGPLEVVVAVNESSEGGTDIFILARLSRLPVSEDEGICRGEGPDTIPEEGPCPDSVLQGLITAISLQQPRSQEEVFARSGRGSEMAIVIGDAVLFGRAEVQGPFHQVVAGLGAATRVGEQPGTFLVFGSQVFPSGSISFSYVRCMYLCGDSIWVHS